MVSCEFSSYLFCLKFAELLESLVWYLICFGKFSTHFFIYFSSSSALLSFWDWIIGIGLVYRVLKVLMLLFLSLPFFSFCTMVCILSVDLSCRSEILFPALFHLLLILSSEFWISNFVFSVLECPFHILIMNFSSVFKILHCPIYFVCLFLLFLNTAVIIKVLVC